MQLNLDAASIVVPNTERALAILRAIGVNATWHEDVVTASGRVGGIGGTISFKTCSTSMQEDADILPREWSIVERIDGPVHRLAVPVTLSIKVTPEELLKVRYAMVAEGVAVMEEMQSFSHENAVTKFTRRYKWITFATGEALGVNIRAFATLAAAKDSPYSTL